MVQHILGTAILNQALTHLQRGEDVAKPLDALVWELFRRRQHSSSEAWKVFATFTCCQNPLMQLVQQDPLTWRAFTKPCGDIGDAVMIDLISAAEDGCDLAVFIERKVSSASAHDVQQQMRLHSTCTRGRCNHVRQRVSSSLDSQGEGRMLLQKDRR